VSRGNSRPWPQAGASPAHRKFSCISCVSWFHSPLLFHVRRRQTHPDDAAVF
jgi:hypothetical protein